MTKTPYISCCLALAICLGGFFSVGVAADEARPPPNILIMVTDDQRWDEFALVQAELGERARFPFIRTRHLDALAAQGMRFRNAFVTTSLCSPSRSAILTGQYNHTNGIINNGTPLSPRPTWATALQAAGYTTAMIGKWHHGNQRDRPGFDYVNTYLAQGEYYDTHFIFNGKEEKAEGYVDSRSVDFAIQFLEEQGDKPFAMLFGFKAVHQPFTPMEQHAQNYYHSSMRPTPNLRHIPPWQTDVATISPILRDAWAILSKKILRTLDGVDQNVGRLLAALDRLDLASNTLVIFVSDNGYYLGEHRLGDKRSAYDESMRIPMIARLPGVIEAGVVSDDLVLNIDIAPTIVDLVIGEVPPAMQGQSLKPLFGKGPTAWREAFLYEYWQNGEGGPESLSAASPTILAVRTPTHKLVTYPGRANWLELFDLARDPYELENLAGSSEMQETRAELCMQLQGILDQTDFNLAPKNLLAHLPPLRHAEC